MNLRRVGSLRWHRLAVGAVMIASPVSSFAQTWTGATSSTWQTASNWNTAVPTSTGTAVFDASSTLNLAITSTAASTVRGLRVVDPAGAISLAGSGLSLGTGGIDMASATQNLTITSGVTVLTGDQNWTVAGGRTLTTAAVPIRNGGANNNNVGGLIKASTSGIIRMGTAASSQGVIWDGGGNPFVTYGLDDWAATDGTGTVVSSAYTVDAFTPNTNVSINTGGAYATGTGAPAYSSVRFNNADAPVTVTNPGTSTQTVRGILMTSTAQAVTITGGNIRPNRVSVAGVSFSIINNSTLGDLTIGSSIGTASSTTPVAIVKSGAGRVVLTSNYSGNGRIFVNEGAFQLGNGGTVGTFSGTANDIVTQPGTTFAVNRSNSVTISNVIIGGGQFTQMGSGSTTLSGTNTFTGAVNIDGGALVFNSASNLGTGTAINFNSGTLVYAGGNTADISARTIALGASGGAIDTGANNVVFANSIGNGGAGGFTKAGSGRLTLAAGGTYAGATTVAAGELRVNGPLSSATVDVAANALLSGTGTLAGAVTIASAATLAPGNAAVGSLTLGSLTTSGGSSLIWEFNTSPANDLVVVTSPNGLTINGGTFSFFSEGTNTPFGTIGTYNLMQYSGAVQGTGVGSLAVGNPAAGKNYTFGESGGFVTLTIASSGLLAQWNVDAAGTWTTASNWTPSEPNGAGDTATFGSVITAPRTVTLNADRTIGNVVFDNANAYTLAPAAAQTLTIGDGAGSRQLQVITGSHTISAPVALASSVGVDVVAGQALALTGPVSGGGALTKTSGGTLRLSGSNSYTGDTTVSGGVIEFTAGAISSGVVTLGGGGVTYAAGNTEDLSAKTVNLAFGGGTVNTGGNDVTFANSIGNFGVGGLTKSGSGTLTLQGANTYTGQTTVRGGVLSVAADANLGDAGTAAGIVLDGGTLRTTAGFTSGRSVNASAASGIDVVGEADTLTLNGVVTGAGLITKSGSGTVVLAGANTAFTGGVTLAGGTVTLAGGRPNGFQGIGTGPITLQNGSVLNLNGFNGSDNGTSWGTLTGPISVAAGQSGVINMPPRGTIASTLTGSGTLGLNVQFIRGELSGNWSGFTGQLNVGTVPGQTTGDFRLNTTTGFGTAAVNLGPGVTMYPVINYANSPQTFTIGELSGDATAVVTGQGGVNSGRIALYSVGGRNTSATFAGTIRDGVVSSAIQPAAVTKVGTGVWTLTGTSTYTGATTVSGGTLQFAGTGAIVGSSAYVIAAGGNATLKVDATGRIGSGTITIQSTGSIPNDSTNKLELTGDSVLSNPIVVAQRHVTSGGAITPAILNTAGTSTLSGEITIVTGGSFAPVESAAGLLTLSGSISTTAATNRNLVLQGAGNGVVSGVIADNSSDVAGTVSVIKNGAGTWALSGVNTMSGSIAINAGTLALAVGGSIDASPTVMVGTNAVFDVSANVGGYVVPASQTLAGSGTVVGAVVAGGGATLAPGAGPGTLAFTGDLTWNSAGNYNWQMLSGTGVAGAVDAWDLVNVTGALSIAATSSDPFRINLWTLSGTSPDVSGPASNFDPSQTYSWKIASATGGITGFAADKFVITTSATNGTGGFANSFTGGTFSLAQSGNDLNLVFTGAPPSVITIDVPSGTQTQGQAGYPTLSGSVPVLKVGGGTLVLDQANPLSGSTTVQGGVLQLANGSALSASRLVVVAGGTSQVAPYVSTSVASLDLASGDGLMDLANGFLTISGGMTSTELVAEILEGRGDGSWTGTSGITSSVAAAEVAASVPRAVGWVDNGDGSLSVAYAAPGDTNIDWSIDILDASNFLAGGKFDTGSPAVWIEGDFSYDGVVDILDAADFFATGLYDAGNYNTAPGLSGGVAAVPEPATTGLLVVAAVAGALALRRRLEA
jgi:fibronectin-binding autotransporter adhesin